MTLRWDNWKRLGACLEMLLPLWTLAPASQARAALIVGRLSDIITDGPQADVRAYLNPTQLGVFQVTREVTDATAAVQAATAAAAALGGGDVVFPRGTYFILPSTSSDWEGSAGGTEILYAGVIMASNVRYWGIGGATLKVPDNYTTNLNPKRFALFFSNQALAGVEFHGLTFDLNGDNNLYNGRYFVQSAIAWSKGSARCDDLVVEYCQFLNINGLSVLMTCQSNTPHTLPKRNRVIHNRFLLATTIDASESSILNFRGEDGLVGWNVFEAPSMRADDKGIGVEFQGPRQKAIGNTIKNLFTGIQIASTYTAGSGSFDQVVSRNIIYAKGHAINIFQLEASAQPMGNLLISDNIIRLSDTATSVSEKSGIHTAHLYPVGALEIRDNAIEKEGNVVPSTGITISAEAGAGSDSGPFTISGNTIKHTYIGMRLQAQFSDILSLTIANNDLLDIQNLASGGGASTGMLVYANAGNIANVSLTGNRMVKTGSAPWVYGVYLTAGTGVLGNIYAEGNTLTGPTKTISEAAVTASATRRQGADLLVRSAMPTSGTWDYSQVVKNAALSEIGSVGSKYVVTGWARIANGSSNVLNTDWVEQRSLTGN